MNTGEGFEHFWEMRSKRARFRILREETCPRSLNPEEKSVCCEIKHEQLQFFHFFPGLNGTGDVITVNDIQAVQ